MPFVVLAHTGVALAPHDLWSAWTWEPAELVAITLTAWLYAIGVRTLWRRAGIGAGVTRWEVAAFAGGWLALVAALVSPLHAMGSVLFSAHMAQHELLMVVAAPLLVLGRWVVPALWAVPPAWRRAAGRAAKRSAVRETWDAITRPARATLLHAVALWAWHAPALYAATLESDLVHAAQHASFLGSALLFWWALLNPRARRGQAGAGVFYLFVTAMHTGALGALIAVAGRPWYPAYRGTTAAWGLTPLEDQQLAGLVMWVPAGLAYIAAALWLFTCWLRESEWRVAQRETREPGAAL